MKINEKAWAILDDHEKTALNLQLGHDKSSWQAGEIMNRSHYKYLEIKYRAEYFLKRFTEHFIVYGAIIPDYIKGDEIAIKYFRLCIEKRKKPFEVFNILFEQDKILKPDVIDKIRKQLKIWDNPENLYDYSTFNLIKDFDRWNNFRILPKDCQEPSAFKRRVKNVYKRQLKTLVNIPAISLQHIKDTFFARRNPRYYLPVIIKKKGQIIPIKTKSNYLEILNGINLYYFKAPQEAQKFVDDAIEYLYKPGKDCRDGLDFWPKFRDNIKKAVNYQIIHNLSPQRKYLEMALDKIEFL